MLNSNNMQTGRHVQKIMEWRESLLKLPDNRFFGLMRMYLGEIKTPYNKQTLVEDLGSFLHKDSVRENIQVLLDEHDIQIISAVAHITETTQDKLSDFFKGTFPFSELYEHLSNLEERLILYRKYDKNQNNSIIRINPILEDLLLPLISISVLLPEPVYSTRYNNLPEQLTPQFLAAFVSYIRIHPDLCKANNSFKKKTEAELKKIFPGSTQKLQKLTTALKNLLLIKENENGFFIDYKKFELFCELPHTMQAAYITAASCGQFSRNGIRQQAQLFLDLCASIPDNGYEYGIFLRAAYIVSVSSASREPETLFAGGRFNRMIEKSRQTNNSPILPEKIRKDFIELLIESALDFGFLSVSGKTKNGSDIIAPVPFTQNNSSQENTLNINAGFSVTILPGLELGDIIPLTRFMDIRHYDTVVQYEITKKSAMTSFNEGLSLNDIVSQLKKFTSYTIPQNLQITLAEWYKSYKSTTLYKGYILQVDRESSSLIEINPKIAPYIYKKLTDGIYLLNATSDKDAVRIVLESNQDFTGSIQSIKPVTTVSGFSRLLPGNNCMQTTAATVNNGNKETNLNSLTNKNSLERYQKSLHEELDHLEMSKDQKEGLENRIVHKIILDKTQLQADSVHTEITEARGMDYAGKIHIIEHALSEGLMLKLRYTIDTVNSFNPLNDTRDKEYLGTPVNLRKDGNDALLTLQLEPDKTIQILSVGQASYIKQIRKSLFSDAVKF